MGGVALSSTLKADAAGTTGVAGSGASLNNMQPALTVGYIIALQGVFPSQSGSGGSTQGTILGEVRRFAGNFVPGGWAAADGSLLQISQNQALFSLLGTTYGGNGTSTFALPDLRGRTPIHFGQGPGLANRALGELGGEESVSLTSLNNAAHRHTDSSGDAIGSSGSNAALDNMMPYLALNFIICMIGTFPARSGSNGATFIGEVRMFAGNFAPAGWAFTNGQLLSISTNTALFSILGTTYGGNGTSTFALPDLRGRAPVGFGNGVGLAPQILGQASGLETFQLTEAQLPAHAHTVATGVNTSSTGGGQAHSNLQPTLALTAIIALVGTFPSQSGSPGDNFLAEVRLFAGNFAPGGWNLTDGSVLPIASNTAVFSLLGTQYGGNGTNNFALPDLQGRAAIHRGQGIGLTPRVIGTSLGTESELLTLAQMGQHSHLLQLATAAPALARGG